MQVVKQQLELRSLEVYKVYNIKINTKKKLDYLFLNILM